MTETQTQGNYNVPAHIQSSNILYLTDPSSEIQRLEDTLRSQYRDDEGKITQYGEPLMNEKGISVILGMVRSVVTQITTMSNLTKQDINKIMINYCENITIILMLKWKEFNLTRSNRPIVKLAAKNPALFCMKRALDEGERRFWKGSQQDFTTTIKNESSNQSLLGRALGWGNKQR